MEESQERTGPLDEATLRATKRAGARAYLVVIRGVGVGTSYPLSRASLIGRGSQADISINDHGVSRSHATIEITEAGQFLLRDLGSRNGTWVEGERVQERELHQGDRISVGGNTLLQFDFQDHLDRQFHESQRMEAIGRLAGGIAHEFNNLLAVILGNLSYLQSRLGEQDEFAGTEMAQSLVDAISETKRGGQLTRDLLGFARKQQFSDVPLDVGEVIRDFVRLVSRTLGRNLRISESLGEDLTVRGDASQLQQLLLNLGLNARDAMPEGGVLRLAARRVELDPAAVLALHGSLEPGQYVEILVCDTGVGMDEETRMHAFEPFFTTKDPGKGTGLGLAVAHGIVRSHGGDICLTSIPAKGTEVRVYVPAVDIEVNKTRELHTSKNVVTDERSRLILVVDDEPGIRLSATRLLETLGHRTMLAADGMQALDLYRQNGSEIDVVLLDLGMPGLDGEEVYFQLREMDPEVKVILCSGYCEDNRLDKLRAAGLRAFLEKPYLRSRLAEAVTQAVT